MSTQLDLNDPTALLLAVVSAFESAGIECAAYGGLALAAYGEPRETRDADLAVVGVPSAVGRDALLDVGLEVDVTFDRVVFGGNVITRLTILGGDDAVGLNTADLVEPRSARFGTAALSRALEGELRGTKLRVLQPEDFVLYKVLSTRDRDVEDAVTVVRALADRLDIAAMEREIDRLAEEIPDHDVRGRWLRVRQVG